MEVARLGVFVLVHLDAQDHRELEHARMEDCHALCSVCGLQIFEELIASLRINGRDFDLGARDTELEL